MPNLNSRIPETVRIVRAARERLRATQINHQLVRLWSGLGLTDLGASRLMCAYLAYLRNILA